MGKLCSKDNGARAWTRATRSAMAVPWGGRPRTGRLWQCLDSLPGDSGIGGGDFRWTASPGDALQSMHRSASHPAGVANSSMIPDVPDEDCRQYRCPARAGYQRGPRDAAGPAHAPESKLATLLSLANLLGQAQDIRPPGLVANLIHEGTHYVDAKPGLRERVQVGTADVERIECAKPRWVSPRTPTVGLAGWMRWRGRSQPRSRMSLPQVLGEAKTLPIRWAYTARVLTGMCRYWGASTMSLMLLTSVGVSWLGLVCGQEERSCRPQTAVEARFHLWYRSGSRWATRKITASGRKGFALVMARRMPALALPSGSRWPPARLNPDARSSARRSRTTAASTCTRRSSFAMVSSNCCRSWSNGSMETTGRIPHRCQEETVERGIASCLGRFASAAHLLPKAVVVSAARL